MEAWQLVKYKDGTIALYFEDSAAGDDIVLQINEDGTASRVTYDDNDEKRRRPVDLYAFLRQRLDE